MWKNFTKSPAAKRIVNKLFGIMTCVLGLFFLDLSQFDTDAPSRLIEFFAAICFLLSGAIRLWLTRRRSRRSFDTVY